MSSTDTDITSKVLSNIYIWTAINKSYTYVANIVYFMKVRYKVIYVL